MKKINTLSINNDALTAGNVVYIADGVSDSDGNITDSIVPEAPEGYENIIINRIWYSDKFNAWVPVHIYRDDATSYVMLTTIPLRVVSTLVATGDTVVSPTGEASYKIIYITVKV